MKRKIIFLLGVILLLCSCNLDSKTQDMHNDNTDSNKDFFVTEKLNYPFGKWLFDKGDMIYWDYYNEGKYSVFVSPYSDNSVAQYKVYSYDCVSGSWETSDFKWNSVLKKANVNMTGNYQQDKKGNIYFCGTDISNKASVKRIYRINPSGQLLQMDSENDLIPAGASISSFRLLENGQFLVATEEQEEKEIFLVDFIGGTRKTTYIPTSVDNMISLNTLTCLGEKFIRIFQQDAGKCAIRIQKFEETMPERVIAFDYKIKQNEGIYSWNLCASEKEDIFFCTSEGIYAIDEKETKEIVSSKELSDVFKEYQDVILSVQFDENTFYLGVQNSDEIALYKVFR